MLVTPQNDGSLLIDEPEKTSGFDMGNRSLFVKTNGRGDLNQIYFAYGGHAGKWQLKLKINGKEISFEQAQAVGHFWKLTHAGNEETSTVSVFMDEQSPTVYERIEVKAAGKKPILAEASLLIDITAPQSPKGDFKDWWAIHLPRLPMFSYLWGKGWGRHLRTPAPRTLAVSGDSRVNALGVVQWQFNSSKPFVQAKVDGKTAELGFKLDIPAGETRCLDFALTDTGVQNDRQPLEKTEETLQNARDYASWLEKQVNISDPFLKSLYMSGLNASLSMFKEFPGGFKGLVAGPDYAYPPRIYFRDGYWTAQALIDTRPDLVREHLLNLSAGVHPDGKCPSGVFAAHLLNTWKAPANCDADWLADHFDSPSFFILLLNDYLQATGNWQLLSVVPAQLNQRLKWPAMTIGQKAHAAIEYLISRDSDGDGLIEKPYAANDWADNINRSTWVSYDQALFIAALRAYAGFCEKIPQGGKPDRYTSEANKALAAMLDHLWDEKLGYLVNYKRPDFTEKNLSADTMVALYFKLLDEEHTQKAIDAAGKKLIANENHEQPFGDYGLLCAYPPYSRQADLFDKSASPYWYHNGADWPYWDGMFSAILLRRKDPRGLHVLTRWWEYGLQQGWLTPVEYYSPAFPVGGMLQGWSSMPASTLFRYLPEVKEQLHATAKK